MYAIVNKGLKSASKKFYFVKDAMSEEVLKDLTITSIITTKERKQNNKDAITMNLASTQDEEELLNFVKFLELEPILVETSTLPNQLTGNDFMQLNPEELANFIKNDAFDLKFVAKSPIQLKMAKECEFFVLKEEYLQKEHYIIKIKNPESDKSPLVRVHSSCYTGDLLGSLRCDCGDQLQESIKFINNHPDFNGGYILYLMQEGRSIGLANKIKAYKMQQIDGLDTVESNLSLGFKDDERNFKLALNCLKFLNLKEVCLITNNPKKSEDLTKLGINVVKTVRTVFSQNQYNESYLKVKEEKMHHSFKD